MNYDLFHIQRRKLANFGVLTEKFTLLMFTHSKWKLRVLCTAIAFAAGVARSGILTASRTYSAGRPHVGLCLKFLVIGKVQQNYLKKWKMFMANPFLYIFWDDVTEVHWTPKIFTRDSCTGRYCWERVLAMGILSVRLSVCLSRPGTDSRPNEMETLSLYHMIASSFWRGNLVPLGEEIPLERGHQRGVPPPLRNRYFTTIG